MRLVGCSTKEVGLADTDDKPEYLKAFMHGLNAHKTLSKITLFAFAIS